MKTAFISEVYATCVYNPGLFSHSIRGSLGALKFAVLLRFLVFLALTLNIRGSTFPSSSLARSAIAWSPRQSAGKGPGARHARLQLGADPLPLRLRRRHPVDESPDDRGEFPVALFIQKLCHRIPPQNDVASSLDKPSRSWLRAQSIARQLARNGLRAFMPEGRGTPHHRAMNTRSLHPSCRGLPSQLAYS